MKAVLCDRCRREIPQGNDYYEVVANIKQGSFNLGMFKPKVKKDYCAECWGDVKALLDAGEGVIDYGKP